MVMKEREIPPQALSAKQATELFRGWIVDDRFVCSLLPGGFKDPKGWGILLADAAHHIANALAESQGADREAVLKSIQTAFNIEMSSPTDEHSGRFVGAQPLSKDEQIVANKSAKLISESMGENGRAVLKDMPVLWLAVAAFGLGVIRSLDPSTGANEERTMALALAVYIEVGMPYAKQYAEDIIKQINSPAIKAVMDEGNRVTVQRDLSSNKPPMLLEDLLLQMQASAKG